MQAAIDDATGRGAPLELPAGRYRVGGLELRPGARIIGAAGATTLEFTGGGAFITADQADGILLEGLVLDGAYQALDDGLVSIAQFPRRAPAPSDADAQRRQRHLAHRLRRQRVRLQRYLRHAGRQSAASTPSG